MPRSCPAPALSGAPQAREMPFPAGTMPVAALLRAALGPHHHVHGAREDLLVAAGAAVHLEGTIGLHHPQVPAVRHPLQRRRLAAEAPRRLLVGRHCPPLTSRWPRGPPARPARDHPPGPAGGPPRRERSVAPNRTARGRRWTCGARSPPPPGARANRSGP